MTLRQHLIGLLGSLALFSSASWGQTSQDCLVCHNDPALGMERAGKTVSLFVDSTKLLHSVHRLLNCIDCHAGVSPDEIPHAKVIKKVKCQTCHDAVGYEKSIHASAQKDGRGKIKRKAAAECIDCHGTHEVLSPRDTLSPTNRVHLSETCGKCHASEVTHFSQSAHGRALAEGIRGAPACIDCHGEHNIEPVASKDSPVYKTHEAKVCLHCHLDNPDVRRRVGPSAGFIASYESSVHGVALEKGNVDAATCSDCHGAHDMKKASAPTSLVNKLKIPETCANCHGDISQTYKESIHGQALLKGNKDVPVCTDCHGEHQIFGPRDPRSQVAGRNVSTQVCATCHNSVQLTRKYGVTGERFQTYEDSYHGLASKAGSVEVANCASCHGYHNIKPSSDPTSTINKRNLALTCGKCHPGANENFAVGAVHVKVASDGEAVLYWIRTFYVSLIIVLIGGMSLHNLADFIKKSKIRLAVREGRIRPEAYGPSLYLRMTLSERLQHGVLLVSFFALVITGFMLRFPDSWWVVLIRRVSEEVFNIRSLVHRVAGVILVAVSLYHIYYVFLVPRGKQLIRDLLPRVQDLRDAVAVAAYNLGFARSKPKFGRFSYVEKLEYWALVWGVIIMASTGVILWFDNFFMATITKLGWDIGRTIHYYEAWLATLAIFVWHIYFVIFNPNVYPMSLAWWKGRLTEEEMAEEHLQELEQIRYRELRRKAEEELENRGDHRDDAGHEAMPEPKESKVEKGKEVE